MRHPPPYVLMILLLGVSILVAGCEGVSFIANAVAPQKIPAQYDLADRPTLVLVDDANLALGNAALADVVASRIAFELKQNKVAGQVVEPQRLSAFRAEHGQAFTTMSIARVGRELGAEQVIHVHIASAALNRHAPHLLQPAAVAQVKVIDAVSGERLFPVTGAGVNEPGRRVQVRFEQSLREEATAGDEALLMRRLSDMLGLQIARMFYKHLPSEPGESLRR